MMWTGWGLWMVLFWAVVIGLIAWAAVRLAPGDRAGRNDRDDRARRVLDERYARGELDTEEYHRRRRELET